MYKCIQESEESAVATCLQKIKSSAHPKLVLFLLPGVNLTPNQTDIGITPWCITWSVDMWLFFFLSTKKIFKISKSVSKIHKQQQ